MPDLSMDTRQVDDVTVVSPRGFVNAHTVKLFEQELSRALEAGRVKIVINGSGLAYIASAGLGVIMGLVEEVRARGGDIRLTDLNETVLNIFEVVGFNHLYQVFDSEREAVASYASGAAG
jgi:anti-sigma B factor antagonist